MAKGLTDRQRRILEHIRQSIDERGYPPSVREICGAVGLSSPASVHAQLDRLERRGYIRRGRMTPRALEVLDASGTPYRRSAASVPLVGGVTAGEPVLAQENIEEYVPLPPELVSDDTAHFVLAVRGDSMIGAGILDGDHVVVRQQETATDGDIVVVLLGEEATVKRFFKEGESVRLQPENPALKPVVTTEAKILGKVVGLYRRI